MHRILILIVLTIVTLWSSSFLFPQVKQLISDDTVQEVASIVDTAKVPPIPAPRIVRDAVDVRESHYAQIGSFRTKESAFAFVREASMAFSNLEVRKAKLPSGIWYRVVSPTDDIESAAKLCRQFEAKGYDCITVTFVG